MAVTRVTPSGWLQETTSTVDRVTPSGWVQETTGGGATITGTGALASQNASAAGAGRAYTTITGTGALASQAGAISGLGVGGLQYARPSADVSDGAWLPSTGADLYACIDEATVDDDDFIYTESASACTVALNPVSAPTLKIGHTVRYRAQGNGSTDLVVTLLMGDTEIATWTETNAATDLTTYSHTLTTGQAESITDYTTLRLEFEAA